MEKIVIKGGTPLNGRMTVSGAKNAALPIIFASILTADKCVIENIPFIGDVTIALEILKSAGASIRLISHDTVEIDTSRVAPGQSPASLVSKIRGSTYLIGAELGRFSYARVGWPGGCDFGNRPIDMHIKGMETLGAKVILDNGFIEARAEDGVIGNTVFFDSVSVGATVNVMLAAVLGKGTTVIDNAAREPHVVDLANFLNTCGADISGAGTDTIKIRGVEALHGCTYAIIPDMIEAGTFMIAAAAAGGEVEIQNVIPKHLESITAKLIEAGTEVEELDDSVIVRRFGPIGKLNVKTLPYPGFPTDMHPQMTALLCQAEGVSYMTETIFDNRFKYIDELRKMGASVKVDGKTAIIEGGIPLSGALVRCVDLRGGAAMIIAGLAASGVTEITDIAAIERGYVDTVAKFKSLGADIRKVYEPDNDALPKAN